MTVLWGIKGAPRCPTAVTQVAAAMASWTGGAWGPAPAQRRAQDAATAAEQAAMWHVNDAYRGTRDAALA
eukprot:11172571-Lingulodinium_polyedra.AAC.1